MSNMSYCRFENTLRDLLDCRDNWDDVSNEDLSSDYERRSKQRLKKVILEMTGWWEDEEAA